MMTHYVPNILVVMGPGNSHWVWQRDNAKPRAAKSTTQYLKDNVPSVLPWPGASPDLSPLDFGYWSILKTMIRRKAPNDLMEMRAALIEASGEMDKSMIDRIIDAFPRRLRRCVELGGDEVEKEPGHVSDETSQDEVGDADLEENGGEWCT